MAAVTLLQKWQLLQAVLCDQDLAPGAKIVAARLLYHHSSQTGRCSPSYQTLADGCGLKRRGVIGAIQDLERHRWIAVDRVKGGDPAAARGFVTNSFRLNFDRLGDTPPVHETTLPPSADPCTPPSAVSDTPPVHETTPPPSADPCTPPSAVSDTPPVHETTPPPVHETALNSGKDTGKGNREESPPTTSDFDEWWRAYPRKVGKDAAQPVFIRITKARKATVAELIEGARRYAAERAEQDPQFTKHPKTWLNGGHWADEAAPKPVSHANGRQPFSALGRLQENMYDDD